MASENLSALSGRKARGASIGPKLFGKVLREVSDKGGTYEDVAVQLNALVKGAKATKASVSAKRGQLMEKLAKEYQKANSRAYEIAKAQPDAEQRAAAVTALDNAIAKLVAKAFPACGRATKSKSEISDMLEDLTSMVNIDDMFGESEGEDETEVG